MVVSCPASTSPSLLSDTALTSLRHSHLHQSLPMPSCASAEASGGQTVAKRQQNGVLGAVLSPQGTQWEAGSAS